jgi:hypothetical protein
LKEKTQLSGEQGLRFFMWWRLLLFSAGRIRPFKKSSASTGLGWDRSFPSDK